MPSYSDIDADFERYEGPSQRSTDVFVLEGKCAPIEWPLGKLPKVSEGRQSHFEHQLARIAAASGHRCLPVHIAWRTGHRNQMDKGCIGHAFGPQGIIESVAINAGGEITHVVLREADGE